MSARQPDAETLLRTEHAVARVLTDAPDEGAAFTRILEAIGTSLKWDTGALWQLDRTALKRIAAWNAPEPFDAAWLHAGEGLPGAVYTSGGPAWIADVQADAHQPRGESAIKAGLHAAFAFPITGTTGVLGVIEFLAKEQREPDDALLATMTSLGGRIGAGGGALALRGPQDRDPRRRLRRDHHDGRRRLHRRGQPRDGEDVRLRGRRHGRARTSPS